MTFKVITPDRVFGFHKQSRGTNISFRQLISSLQPQDRSPSIAFLIRKTQTYIHGLRSGRYVIEEQEGVKGRLLNIRSTLRRLNTSYAQINPEGLVSTGTNPDRPYECWPDEDWCGRDCNCVFNLSNDRISF